MKIKFIPIAKMVFLKFTNYNKNHLPFFIKNDSYILNSFHLTYY